MIPVVVKTNKLWSKLSFRILNLEFDYLMIKTTMFNTIQKDTTKRLSIDRSN